MTSRHGTRNSAPRDPRTRQGGEREKEVAHKNTKKQRLRQNQIMAEALFLCFFVPPPFFHQRPARVARNASAAWLGLTSVFSFVFCDLVFGLLRVSSSRDSSWKPCNHRSTTPVTIADPLTKQTIFQKVSKIVRSPWKSWVAFLSLKITSRSQEKVERTKKTA